MITETSETIETRGDKLSWLASSYVICIKLHELCWDIWDVWVDFGYIDTIVGIQSDYLENVALSEQAKSGEGFELLSHPIRI